MVLCQLISLRRDDTIFGLNFLAKKGFERKNFFFNEIIFSDSLTSSSSPFKPRMVPAHSSNKFDGNV
jgi:hypothetical protein